MRIVAAIEVIGAVAGIVPRPDVAGSAAALCRRLLRVDVQREREDGHQYEQTH